ncbi:helix-turn-helix domain-containing protein [Fictibacillus sp. BK138]|uniref:helix-turn-helix domain-containing protein n=1 Tax=Fictibacillus sp. BK138 TaxID=2512121 RepID=UPI001029B1F6|nr:helix-turn-helix domain-containing protein [Fictibacillus sp. BK138]RZT21357.1 anti-repressor SinI [Fictibacillus sp. BK138]
MKQSLGKQIKKQRLRKGMSISKLAKIADVSKGYLSSIESYKTNPSAHIIQKLAKALEVPVEQLLDVRVEKLDPEWVELVTQAKEIGINKEDIRAFLAYEAWKQNVKEEV